MNVTKALASLVVAASMAINGCAVRSIDGFDYTEVGPEFRIEQFFDGHIKAWGIVQDRSGSVIQRFKVDIEGRWDDGVLMLDESFNYSIGDGVKSRIWKIEPADSGEWIGRADDILDTASGRNYGNAFRWRYQMDLPVDGRSYKVSFDDWIWAFDSNTLINRSYITKFGITFAEITLFMQKQRGV